MKERKKEVVLMSLWFGTEEEKENGLLFLFGEARDERECFFSFVPFIRYARTN